MGFVRLHNDGIKVFPPVFPHHVNHPFIPEETTQTDITGTVSTTQSSQAIIVSFTTGISLTRSWRGCWWWETASFRGWPVAAAQHGSVPHWEWTSLQKWKRSRILQCFTERGGQPKQQCTVWSWQPLDEGCLLTRHGQNDYFPGISLSQIVCLICSFSQMVCYVIWSTPPTNGAFFTPCPTVRVLSAAETPAVTELHQTTLVTVLGKQHIFVHEPTTPALL